MDVTRAESFPKVEKREMITERMRPMMPVFVLFVVVFITMMV